MAKKKKPSKVDTLVVRLDDLAQLNADKNHGIPMDKKVKNKIESARKKTKK